MGLNIGIEVIKQPEGYMSNGSNPKGTIEEVEGRFFDFLHSRFPAKDGNFGFGRGWVSLGKRYDGKDVYDFNVRMFGYAEEFQENGYTQDQMYLAIVEFIFNEFSNVEGVVMRTYWSG